MSRTGATKPEVRVGGQWLSSIAPHGWGGLDHSTRPTGSWDASWSLPFVGTWRHPALTYGAAVEIHLGPIVLWSGRLDEPDWDGGTFSAIGSARDGENAIGFNVSGEASTAPNMVVDQGIARGVLSWTRGANFGTTPVGEADDEGALVTIDSILTAWGQKNGTGWHVTPQRRLIQRATGETTPKWLVIPGSGVLGSAADDRADRVFVRYTATTTGLPATASYPASTPAGGIERAEDITDRGVMSQADAQAVAQSLWAGTSGRSGWSNGLTLTSGQVTTLGGQVADLAFIAAGDTVRLLGVPDPRGVGHNLDVVIGETSYDWTTDTLQINPVGMAARTTDAVFEQIGSLAAAAYEKASTPTPGDSGWINMASNLTSGTARYRSRGGYVTIQIDGAQSTTSGSSAVVVTAANSVPAALRPTANARSGGYFAGFPGTVSIATTGEITALHQSGASRASVSATLTYPIG